jgi:hypothetical protein
MDQINSSDARRRLLHLLTYLAQAGDITDIDGMGEAAYAALYSMGLDTMPQLQVGAVLASNWEAAAVEQLAVNLDEALTVIGNCETETNNMKAAAWVRVREAAQAAYDMLENQTFD